MKDAALVFILVLLILAVGLAVALSLEPETETRDKGALECVTGEAALNPTRVSDRSGRELILPTDARFTTIAEAEAWVCHRVPLPQLSGEWEMTQVWATRSHHLEMIKQNRGFWSIVYALRNVPREITLNVENVPGGNYSPCGTERTVEIRGQSATLFEDCSRPGHVTVQWNRGDVTLLVNTFYSEGFGRDGLLSVLETFE